MNHPFYNYNTGEVASLTGLFSLVTSAIGVQGLMSLDRLFALRAKEMCLRRDIIDFSDALIFHEKTWIIDMLDNLSDSLSNGSVMANPAKFYYQVLHLFNSETRCCNANTYSLFVATCGKGCKATDESW